MGSVTRPEGQTGDVYSMVRSIRRQQLSRNRNFDEHATPHVRRGLRIPRFLRGLERDVLGATMVSVRPDGSGYQISLHFSAVRLTRVVTVSNEEYSLLSENPQVVRRLGGC